jgi:uncharacterized membrane protein
VLRWRIVSPQTKTRRFINISEQTLLHRMRIQAYTPHTAFRRQAHHMLKLIIILALGLGALVLALAVLSALASFFMLKALLLVGVIGGALIGLQVADSNWGAVVGGVLGLGASVLLLLALDDGK